MTVFADDLLQFSAQATTEVIVEFDELMPVERAMTHIILFKQSVHFAVHTIDTHACVCGNRLQEHAASKCADQVT